MRTLSVIVLICAGLIIGCDSSTKLEFGLENRRVTIITEPEGASVTQLRPMSLGMTLLGTTPLNEQSVVIVSKIKKVHNLPYHDTVRLLEHVGNVVVTIEKKGYKSYSGILETKPDQTVVHKIILMPDEK